VKNKIYKTKGRVT